MGLINQNIAIRANKEDNCKGRFWEARFSSQAILDYDALLRTLIYVDLNPVKAGISASAESSQHTSMGRRMIDQEARLLPFQENDSPEEILHDLTSDSLPISYDDYRDLLNWTQEIISQQSKPSTSPPPNIFSSLNYSSRQWRKTQKPQVRWQQRALGSATRIKKYCEALNRRWIWQAPDHTIAGN